MRTWEEIQEEMSAAVNKVEELEKENEAMSDALGELSDYCELHSEKLWEKFQDILDRNSVYLRRVKR